MSLYRNEIEALKAARENLATSLQEKGSALASADRQCQELQTRLQEIEAEKERISAEKNEEGQTSAREAEELRSRAQQEFALARWVVLQQSC